METKICKKCGGEFLATIEYWHKQLHGKYGLKSVCKKCTCDALRNKRHTDEYREYNRIRMIEWRKANHEKQLEIQRRAYIKHKDRYNEKRKDRYKTDPEYKRKRIEAERKYKESGRRSEVSKKPEQREKAKLRSRIRRLNPKCKEHDYKRSAIWREENKEYLLKRDQKRREELDPHYIANCMKKKHSELSPEIIETKKLIIILKRELKKRNIKIR